MPFIRPYSMLNSANGFNLEGYYFQNRPISYQDQNTKIYNGQSNLARNRSGNVNLTAFESEGIADDCQLNKGAFLTDRPYTTYQSGAKFTQFGSPGHEISAEGQSFKLDNVRT